MAGAGKRKQAPSAPRQPSSGARKRAQDQPTQAAAPAKRSKVAAAEVIPEQVVHHDLCPPAPLRRAPVDGRDVEAILNRHLSDTQIHGSTWRIKATLRKSNSKGSNKAWFQLRCGTCQHHTCSWSGRAWHDQTSKLLHATAIANRAHGEPKHTDQKAGRKAKDACRTFPLEQALVFKGEVSQKTFHAFVEKHFRNLPLEQSLLVRCKTRPATKRGLTCRFFAVPIVLKMPSRIVRGRVLPPSTPSPSFLRTHLLVSKFQ